MKRNSSILISLTLLTLTTPPAFAGEMDMNSHKHMQMDGGAASQGHQGVGTVNSVDVAGGKVNLSHEPIVSLRWPAMTMDLDVMESASLSALKPGQKVVFKLVEKRKGKYVISEISVVK